MLNPFVKIVAFDTETTGLDSAKDEVIEIGALLFSIKMHQGRLVPERLSEFQSLIKSPKPVPEQATKINNITNEMLADAPLPFDVLKKFKEFCDPASCLIAHNAPFDIGFLNSAYGKHSAQPPATPILDSIKIARNCIQLPDYKLGNITQALSVRNEISLKIEKEKAHRALYDCEMLMHITIALLRGKLTEEEWTANIFLPALKKKDIHPDAAKIKPVMPKPKGFF